MTLLWFLWNSFSRNFYCKFPGRAIFENSSVSLDIHNKNNFQLACSLHDFVGHYIGYAIKFNKYDGFN